MKGPTRRLTASLVVLGCLLAAPAAHAVEITPNTLGDEYNTNPSTCSLREAVQAANTDAAFDGCIAGSGPDEIALGPGVYEFDRSDTGGGNSNGDLDVIGSSVTISHDGGSRSVIDALDIDRVLNILPGAFVTIDGVELRGGRVTSENAGGIANQGDLTMTNATVADNEILTGGYGAGIWSLSGTVHLTNVTISGNTSPATSAGAGGLYVNTIGNTLTNVTISDNSGGGGSGGGIYLSTPGVLTLKNTIVAGNTAAGSPDCSAGAGTAVNSLDKNLIGDTAGCTTYSSQSGDVPNMPAGLSDLADNGGPVSTHALSPTSLPVDLASAADCSGLTTDARGFPRPFPASGRCDIGAYELHGCPAGPLNQPGPFGGCPVVNDPPAPAPTPKKKCKKGRKLKKGKCVKKKRKKR